MTLYLITFLCGFATGAMVFSFFINKYFPNSRKEAEKEVEKLLKENKIKVKKNDI